MGVRKVSSSSGPRVVSLVPSITETLLAWGVRPIGVTRFCPAKGVQRVGGTKNPDLALILSLEPDLVLMDRQENRLSDAQQLRSENVEVLDTDVTDVQGVAGALERLSQALDVKMPSQSSPVLADHPPGQERIEVFVPIWRRPWMTVGARTYGSSLLAQAGLRNAFADERDPYPQVSLESAARIMPAAVLAPSEPYPFGERHRGELERVAPVTFVDGRDLFWWGVRTSAALGRLKGLAASLAAGTSSAEGMRSLRTDRNNTSKRSQTA